MRIYWTNNFKIGNLGMMARPKGNDWLEDEILKLKQQGVSTVISLLEEKESYELEIEYEKSLCNKHELAFVNFPIKDREVPEDLELFVDLLDMINQKINEDKKVAVHCRMGIGRTSLVAAAVLIGRGMSSENVFSFLSEKRTLEVPDTKEQIEWIMKNRNVFFK